MKAPELIVYFAEEYPFINVRLNYLAKYYNLTIKAISLDDLPNSSSCLLVTTGTNLSLISELSKAKFKINLDIASTAYLKNLSEAIYLNQVNFWQNLIKLQSSFVMLLKQCQSVWVENSNYNSLISDIDSNIKIYLSNNSSHISKSTDQDGIYLLTNPNFLSELSSAHYFFNVIQKHFKVKLKVNVPDYLGKFANEAKWGNYEVFSTKDWIDNPKGILINPSNNAYQAFEPLNLATAHNLSVVSFVCQIPNSFQVNFVNNDLEFVKELEELLNNQTVSSHKIEFPDYEIDFHLANKVILAFSLVAQGKFLEAKKLLHECVDTKITFAPIYTAFTFLNLAQNKIHDAFIWSECLIFLDPNKSSNLALSAAIHAELGRLDEAELRYGKAVRREPLGYYSQKLFASFLFKQKKYNEALKLFELVSLRAPHDYIVKLSLVETLYQLNEISKAKDKLKEIEVNYPNLINDIHLKRIKDLLVST